MNKPNLTDQRENLAKLKYDISVAIVAYKCRQLGCDAGKYGQVYDSEAHEKLLSMLVKIVWAADNE